MVELPEADVITKQPSWTKYIDSQWMKQPEKLTSDLKGSLGVSGLRYLLDVDYLKIQQNVAYDIRSKYKVLRAHV
jgi:hypothetical protein